jgi:PPK2 family polyphosphate:nucleotide phosphotransferase
VSIDYSAIARSTVVEPGRKVELHRDFDPARTPRDLDKQRAVAELAAAKQTLFELQDKFYAQADRALLIVLQAIDAAGKDSTVKHVMSGMNPQGVDVSSFKAPSTMERSHDYLWRHQLVLPELGRIAVFNRSHYENVTVTRVHPDLLWPKTGRALGDDVWRQRYRHINEWERYLTDNGTTVVKLFLHVSKEQQRKRFLERVDDPTKNWKVSPADLVERGYWDGYAVAFSEMLSHTSTEWAPWHVIPADRKWFSHLATFSVLLDTMQRLNPAYPEANAETRAHLSEIRQQLKAEAPKPPL